MASLVIGLLGRKRSGKDTFAQRLVDAHGFRRFAFADALKDAALHLNPIIGADDDFDRYYYCDSRDRLRDVVDACGWEIAKEHAEVRRVLQHMGTGVRELDPDFWLRVVLDAVDAHDGRAVITDVRFPNEAAAVQARGYAVRINRPGIDMSDTHISETALDHVPVDAEVHNTGTIEALHEDADSVVEVFHWNSMAPEPPC